MNANLQANYAASNNKIYLSIDEKLFWKFLAMKMMSNLASRGKVKHLESGVYEKVMGLIGKNRYKVL